MKAVLALEDGRVFRGRSIGSPGERTGEVVFNTSMAGYQEVLTDPSYRGQIVTMTYPEIGNYGVNEIDVESAGPQVSGFVVRQMSELHSNWRASKDLNQYLRENRIVGIEEIDTRALTRHLRSRGVLRGCVSTLDRSAEELVRMAKDSPQLSEMDLVGQVTCPEPYVWDQGHAPIWAGPAPAPPTAPRNGGSWGRRSSDRPAKEEDRRFTPHVVAYDYGAKRNILRCLREAGARVTAVPASFPAEEALARKPDGIFLSNGPGDPTSAGYAVDVVRRLVGRVPIFGICLGHQILGLAMGARTFKLKFGHRGANQPVKDLATGRIEITAQNHGYAVDEKGLPSDIEVTHLNLNDGTIEGFAHGDKRVFSVQYHPESSPGPHDSLYLFDRFFSMMMERSGKGPDS